jgi:hypothetical protein
MTSLAATSCADLVVACVLRDVQHQLPPSVTVTV